MLKKLFISIFFFVFLISNASAEASLEMIWKSDNLLIKNSTNIEVKEIVKINNNYYIFKEYNKNSNKYFAIQQIDSNKKVINELEFGSTSYEYKIVDDKIIVVNFIYRDSEKSMQLYEYNLDLEIENKEVIEFTDTRTIKDSTILITDNSILFAFSINENNREIAMIFKYNYNFELVDNMNQLVNQTGITTNHQYILKTDDSIVFLNRTYHYKANCENATKINGNLELISISKCMNYEAAQFPAYYCDDEKCNYQYDHNYTEYDEFYSYDADTHSFYDIGEYLPTEKDANLLLQTYKYNELLEFCEGDYCETQKINDKYTILIEYEGMNKNKIKVYDLEKNLLYLEEFDKFYNVVSAANEQRIALSINMQDKSKIIILDSTGKLQNEIIIENVSCLSLDNDSLMVYQTTEKENNLVEYVEVNEPEIIKNENGTIDYNLINENGEYKLNITITPKDGYALKEVKVTDESGKITIYKEMNFILNNGQYKIETVFTKIENPLTYDLVITIILAFITSVISCLLYKNIKGKRYAN